VGNPLGGGEAEVRGEGNFNSRREITVKFHVRVSGDYDGYRKRTRSVEARGGRLSVRGTSEESTGKRKK